ncbi:unnamed protein product [Schistocephalus solidus]|uniref:F-box domain-containing protein n=1 Tax=Schistocephalus solidus TaxID=70667 RepID=A0A183SYE4_SCHSO|nr:unnamed protein product [Schistocephalus solidus]
MNWCTACGCLLIGYDPQSQISTYPEFPQHQTRYGDVSYTAGCTYDENSHLGLCFPVQYPKLSTGPSHSSGEITRHPPKNCNQFSFPLAYGDNGIQMIDSFSTPDSRYSRSFGRDPNLHSMNIQDFRQLRQRHAAVRSGGLNSVDDSTVAVSKNKSETASTSTSVLPSNACSGPQNKEEVTSNCEEPVESDEVKEVEYSLEESSSHDAQNWLSLPTELWFLVVNALDYADRATLARTCRRLHTIVSDRHFWRVIRLDRYRHLTDAGLAAIGRKRPQELHLIYCRGDSVTTKGVRQLFSSCGKSLQRLSFIGCSKGAFQGDSILLISALYCKNLSHIDASYAHTVRDQTIRAVAEASVALKSVQLNGAQNISNSAIEHLVRYHKSSLERLELFGCFRLNSKIFTTLGECHGLKALAFGFLHHLSSTGLLELVSKLPLLASLDLRGTQKLVTDVSLTRLATKCPFLEEIVLANMSSITKEDGVVTMLHGLPRLRVLDLCGLSVVGDDTLQALAASCPLLEELDVSCTSVTEKGLLHLANAPARNLKSLRISFCDHITKDALENVVAACPRLTQIALYGFSWIDRWNFLFNIRPNLVIQAETQTLTAASVQLEGEKAQS